MSALVVDCGVDTPADLGDLLPGALAARIDPDLLAEGPTAAALRVLATLRDQGWVPFVYAARIDWTPMLEWARGNRASSSVRARVELAASLAGCVNARPDLLRAATGDKGNFTALLDALRIAREGLGR